MQNIERGNQRRHCKLLPYPHYDEHVYLIHSPFSLALHSQFVREAVWFSRREKIVEDELFRFKNRSYFCNVRTQRGKMSAFEFVQDLAVQAQDDELIDGILHHPSLFEGLYHGRFPDRRGSLQADLASKISRHESAVDKKYGIVRLLTGGILTISFSAALVAAMIKGFVEGGGMDMSEDVQSAVMAQLVCASISTLLIGTAYAAGFIGEAVKDFNRHKRVLLKFMQSVGHLNDAEISAKGHPELMSVANTDIQYIVKETSGDLQAIFTIYDLIREYIKLRTNFHSGFLSSMILSDVAAAVLFLVSASFEEVNLGPVATNLLFVFALVSAVLLIAIARPLVRSSFLIHDDWLDFLVRHQLFLLSELASPTNAHALSETERQTYREQVQQLDSKIQQMRVQPARIKVLGVEATMGSLVRVLSAVGGSLLSGLMRQAADTEN